MTRHLPSNDDVRRAMDQVLADARTAGRYPTVAAVERALDVSHATFYRNYRDLITGYFQPQQATKSTDNTRRAGQLGLDADSHKSAAVQRLRQENTDLRRLVAIYEEVIRQLTLTNHELRDRLHNAPKITTLPPRDGPQ